MPTDREELLRLERGTLDGGAELVRQNPPAGSPTFCISALVPAGWGYDPARSEGLALMVSELAVCGAGRLRRAELARELDRYGASLSSQVHPEAAEITLAGPTDHLPRLLPLFAEALLRPRFDRKEAARIARRIIERQMRERTQPDQCAEKELFRRLFPSGHPYRATGLGTPRAVRSLDRADLVRFHRDHFASPGSVVVATCRESLVEIARRLDRVLGSWPAGPTPSAPRLTERAARPEPPARLEVPGGSQVEIRVGGPSLPRSDAGYEALLLANELLGGRPLLSRLFQTLREDKGLVYHTGSELEAMRWGGYWIAEAGTRPTQVESAARLLTLELERLATEPPAPAELDRIRESLIGSIWLELETTASAHELAVDAAYHHLPEDFYQRWPARLRAVTPRQVRDAAARGMDPRRASTVIAGPLRRSRPVGPVRTRARIRINTEPY
jgi:predicted Zn-dependent peptidase